MIQSTPQVLIVMKMRIHYEKGFFPVAGGILDQSASFLEAMEILNEQINKLVEEDLEKSKNN